MSLATTIVSFGEWLPDQPDLGGTGLITAKNVLPANGGYTPFFTLDTSLATLPGTVDRAGFGVRDAGYIYAHAQLTRTLFSSVNGTTFISIGTMPGRASFAQFDNYMMIASDQTAPALHTISSTATLTSLSASITDRANCIGVVNRFVVIGNLNDTVNVRYSSIRWSALDDPTNWPTPNSATAIATQAGEQALNSEFGAVMAIHGGDQHAVILQKGAVTRMTYVGPPVVFQFDTIDNTKGLYFDSGSIKVGNLVYFMSSVGFCVTDGTTVRRLGDGKVDRYFWSTYYTNDPRIIRCGHDPSTGLIYFGYNTDLLPFDIDRVIIYNPATDSFTFANQDLATFVTPVSSYSSSNTMKLLAFGIQSNSILGKFEGAPGTATFETSDVEITSGGRSFVSGVKPHIESSGTAPAVTVRVASRNDLATTPSYTATTTPTTRTGFADFRVDAKYHRAEVQIVGTFNRATGLEFIAAQSGKA